MRLSPRLFVALTALAGLTVTTRSQVAQADDTPDSPYPSWPNTEAPARPELQEPGAHGAAPPGPSPSASEAPRRSVEIPDWDGAADTSPSALGLLPGPDPALVAGLVLATAGLASASIGMAVNAGAEKQECSTNTDSFGKTKTECLPRDDPTQAMHGHIGIAAGLGILAVAVPAITIGMFSDAPARRRNNATMTLGIVMTAMGAAALAAGAVVLEADENDDATMAGIALLPVSGALLGPGIPLWVKGAGRKTSDNDARAPTPRIASFRLSF